MTRDRDFKRLIRQRMETTGENYTAARSALSNDDAVAAPPLPAQTDGPLAPRTTAYERAAAVQRKAVRAFVDADGRLRSIPAKRSARMAVLLELVARFDPGRSYPEREVNAILAEAHEDYAYLRRELVNVGYLERVDSIYRLTERVPERDPRWAHEFPEWERIWLPTHLAGFARRVTDGHTTG